MWVCPKTDQHPKCQVSDATRRDMIGATPRDINGAPGAKKQCITFLITPRDSGETSSN